MASFQDFALVCQALSQTGSRLKMAELAGEFLAQLEPGEAESAARFMVGRALATGDTRRLNISGRAVWKIVAAMANAEDQAEEIFAAAVDFGEAVELTLRRRSVEPEPSLAIAEVAREFEALSAVEGRHARGRRLEMLRGLFERASTLEAKYLAKILIREMRHGMSEGLMLEAIARMAGRPVSEVRRLNMLEGDVGKVVRRLRTGDSAVVQPQQSNAEASGTTSPTRPPLRPMLAQPAPSVAAAFATLGGALALEHKLDGARVQIHLAGGAVRIYTRRLNEITSSLPEVAERMHPLAERRAIFDGEVIAVDENGRPRAFQEVMRRFGRTREVARLSAEQPIRLFLFDLLALDGALLIDEPYQARAERLREVADEAGLKTVARVVRASVEEGERFFHAALAAGHEGVMAKLLSSPYTPGARGRGWLKIKRARTLDLVIVAAEWGYGRRHGWLSNYHLAARGESGFVEVGKTFKGLDDEELSEMTERLLALKTGEDHGVVTVRPEVVVEVAYSDLQRSPRYEGGVALRFARVVGIRRDKDPAEADTLATLRAEFERQLTKPADR